jgi:hypothetical protein
VGQRDCNAFAVATATYSKEGAGLITKRAMFMRCFFNYGDSVTLAGANKEKRD